MEKEMLFYHLTIDVKQVGEDEVGKDFCEIISPQIPSDQDTWLCPYWCN